MLKVQDPASAYLICVPVAEAFPQLYKTTNKYRGKLTYPQNTVYLLREGIDSWRTPLTQVRIKLLAFIPITMKYENFIIPKITEFITAPLRILHACWDHDTISRHAMVMMNFSDSTTIFKKEFSKAKTDFCKKKTRTVLPFSCYPCWGNRIVSLILIWTKINYLP